MASLQFASQERALDFLDSYASDRKEEIDRHRLQKDSGFIKSYTLETAANSFDLTENGRNLERLIQGTGWELRPIEENRFYTVNQNGDALGFLEPLSPRYFAVHTFMEARQVDRIVRNTVKETSQLDFVWLAGNYLNLIWENLIRDAMPQRYVSFKFEHLGRFEDLTDDLADDDEEDVDDSVGVENEQSVVQERRASTLKVTARVSKVAGFLPKLQDVLPDFKAIKMLRIPASDMPGGYEFWDWGKVTHRSGSFRDGRAYLTDLVSLYQMATEVIERISWFQTENVRVGEGQDSFRIQGAPLTFLFPEPLDTATFNNFIQTTFERVQGPFRLLGNPIRFSDTKVHVYGIDMHLWQRIYMELTPSRFIIVLPRGTCGNTVHRLVSNIQRYISPDVEAYIGDYRYEQLVKDVLFGRISSHE